MLEFDFYPTPDPEGTGRKRYHARVVSRQSIDTERLAEEIQKKSGLSAGAVEDVLITLGEKLSEHLGDGDRVHLKGVGYFQVNLCCKKEITNPNGVRSENVDFKSVSFRADNALKAKLRKKKLIRSQYSSHSRRRTEATIDKLLTKYFVSMPGMTRRDFQFLTGQLRATACRTIKRLVEAGKLKNIGADRSPVYVPCEGYYGK